MPSSRTCADCGIFAPLDTSDSLLLGTKHGWRLSRETDDSGAVTARWRCPKCWAERRKELEKTIPGTGATASALFRSVAAALKRKDEDG
jgi:hypothetical protein